MRYSVSHMLGFPAVEGRRALTPVDLESGTRRDVARRLAEFALVSADDGYRLLEHAWRADRRCARTVDPQWALTDREVDSLILDLTVSRNYSSLYGATVAGLYLAGELRVARRLAVAVGHPQRTFRESAFKLCWSLTDPKTLDAFPTPSHFVHPEAEITALRLICRLGGAAQLSTITDALTHSAEVVCFDAMGAVVRLRPPKAAALLAPIASRRSPVLCVRAMTALGELGDLSLLPKLMEELGSESSFHRIGAARGLTALAVLRPDGDFTAVLEALQKKARLGGVEHRRALEAIRKALGIDPNLPIPAPGNGVSPASLPIPGSAADFAVFEKGSTPLPLDETPDEEAEIDDDSLARRLNNMLPRPEDWEYD